MNNSLNHFNKKAYKVIKKCRKKLELINKDILFYQEENKEKFQQILNDFLPIKNELNPWEEEFETIKNTAVNNINFWLRKKHKKLCNLIWLFYSIKMFVLLESEKLLPDNKQRKIIKSKKNHLIINADAGTGKTFTLVEKIKFLEKQNNCKKSSKIKVLTLCSSDKLIEKIEKNFSASKQQYDKEKYQFFTLKVFPSKLIKQSDETKNKKTEYYFNFLQEYFNKSNENKIKLNLFLRGDYDLSSKDNQIKIADKLEINEYCTDNDGKLLTINGELVRSNQERIIANFFLI